MLGVAHIILHFKGVYKVTNLTISDTNLPFSLHSQAVIICKFVGKVRGRRSSLHLYTVTMLAKVDKN